MWAALHYLWLCCGPSWIDPQSIDWAYYWRPTRSERRGLKMALFPLEEVHFHLNEGGSPQASCFLALHVWIVLTVFHNTSLHPTASCPSLKFHLYTAVTVRLPLLSDLPVQTLADTFAFWVVCLLYLKHTCCHLWHSNRILCRLPFYWI